MAGFPTTKNDIDARVGGVIVTLRDTLESATRIKAWLDTQTDADLTGRGYTSTEVAQLKSAFTDLDNLRKVANGVQGQANANDFFFWADKLTGLL